MSIQDAWVEFSNHIELGGVCDRDMLFQILSKNGANDINIEDYKLGNLNYIHSFYITCSLGKAIFPMELVGAVSFEQRFLSISNIISKWMSLEWFLPAFANNSLITKCMGGNANHLKENEIYKNFNENIAMLYNIEDICVFIEQMVPMSVVLSGHQKTLRESILSAYTGYPAAAIAALMPMVENSLDNFCRLNNNFFSKNHIRIGYLKKKIIDNFFSDDVWIDDNYKTYDVLSSIDTRLLISKVFFEWLSLYFFKNIDDYKGKTGLNRHIFSHGTSVAWQKPSNFHRLIGVLNNIFFLERYFVKDGVSILFYPDINSQAEFLFKSISIRASSQLIYKHIESIDAMNSNDRMSETTNDNGWLYRASILSSRVMDGLVERLRDNSWYCKVGEPIEDGEYMKVIAEKETKVINIAILFTCATDNKIYKYLSLDCEVILYLGAPYRESSYAYGITSHVGPLQAWVIPS